MGTYSLFQQWVIFLRGAEPLIGIPLLVVGVGLVLTGWRVWPFAATVTGGLIGASLGQMLSGGQSLELMWAGGGAILFALVTFLFMPHAVVFLGGFLGAGISHYLLSSLHLPAPMQWLVVILAFVGVTAWAFANRHRVVVAITSLEGGVLSVSGAAVLLSSWPWMHRFFQSMTLNSPLVLSFFVLVPTVVGITLQHADVNRSSSKAVRG